MAAQSSSKSPTAAAAVPTGATATAAAAVVAARRKSVVSDPNELLLLREKLNQIAVGLRFRSPSADDDDDNYGELQEDYDEESERLRRRRRQQHGAGGGHFKVFPLLGERPSTPPSSPQPRDVLRKQLRLRNSSFRLDDLPSFHSSSSHDNDGSDDSAMRGVSVDAVEISRFESAAHAQPSHVRLSIPGHLRVRSASSFSVLTTKPEGMRKRKSDHVADKQHPDGEDAAGPLKKASSEKNILAATTWDYDAVAARGSPARRRVVKDQEMEDASPESPYDSDVEKLCL